MKLACPSCGALMSLDVIVAHDGARDAVQAALQLPAPLGKLIIQYLTLFRPEKRQLTLERVASILGDLLPMIESGRINRDGKEYAIALPVWAAGLQEIQDRHKQKPLTTPLKSHGYLLEILINKAGSMEAKAEARREEQRRQPPAREQEKRTGGMVKVAHHLSNMKAALAGRQENEISFAELTEKARQKEIERNQQQTETQYE
jgi:hypothetical protein